MPTRVPLQSQIIFTVVSIEVVGPATQYLPLKPESVPKVTRGELDQDWYSMTVRFNNGKVCRFEK